MIYILAPEQRKDALDIVYPALCRSFTPNIVFSLNYASWEAKLSELSLSTDQRLFLVLIDPLDVWVDLLIKSYEILNVKIIIFGSLPVKLASYFNASIGSVSDEVVQSGGCQPAPTFSSSESRLYVDYKNPIGAYHSPTPSRPFLRYDFTDEWNNLGYGAIRTNHSIWALSQILQVTDDDCIASIMDGDKKVSAYVALWNSVNASLLWFNRPVGPVDSQEWFLIEVYFARYRSLDLPCVPYLSEIPFGYEAAVTMRLDCDEDIESARLLWKAYLQLEVPFSLAIHTKVLSDKSQYLLPKEVLASGGAILSHTATHAPDWGGTYEAAFEEAITSKNLIESKIGCEVRYAVSPFHQTPVYAREALLEAGYMGCIGGIIRNDPDFLMARSGVPPLSKDGFIGHSQQCMLHGDCMIDSDDPISTFKQAFKFAQKSETFFGYLDHPFSPRYQYGWKTEEQRIKIHQDFICYIKSYPNVLFANQNDALDFLTYRSKVRIEAHGLTYKVSQDNRYQSKWAVKVNYKDSSFELDHKGVEI